jgi:hypothetical protein
LNLTTQAASLFAAPPKPAFDAESRSRDYSTAFFTAQLGARKLDVRARVSGSRHSSINLFESKPLADFIAHANALLERSGTRNVIEPPRRAPNNDF